MARAAGVFDRLAADTLKSVVTTFEVFARDQFTSRAANPLALKRNVFQRLDNTAKLIAQHCGVDLPATVGLAVWARLREDFARRHVLTHCGGIIDAKFLAAVPSSSLMIGQRLLVGRADAKRGHDDVETVVQTLGAHP
ncbi:MAG: hypothetical protein ACLP01_26035 [Solirubrobacteraceae bacterium]